MSITLKERFARACLAAGREEQARIFQVLRGLDAALARAHEYSGLGLRKLHPSGVWEVRIGLRLRALFLLARDEAIFLFLATHDEVKRFLRDL